MCACALLFRGMYSHDAINIFTAIFGSCNKDKADISDGKLH